MALVQKPTINLFDIVPHTNKDGSVSTVKSMSIGMDGLEFLIPTVVDGKVLTEEQAIKQFDKTGNHLGAYSDPESATKGALGIHNLHDFLINNSIGKQVNKLLQGLIPK